MNNKEKEAVKIDAVETTFNKISRYMDFHTFQSVRPELINELSALYETGYKVGMTEEALENLSRRLPEAQSER